ncbi:ExeA family protein [Erythrobacter rubeus]|uniref:AAA family ATPase n=1 Tax=Erythrobacter rubeus TaxID=2760803 RepID=A0ABR8KTA4_9SPHN|nr:AAA family ATPase [Erythrobacter rubeus]MBD2841669.1 AAA family ATPase [Erythrobacter rubeus]
MYHQFYGFEGRPFELTSDPAFYFESASHRKALSYLGLALDQREGFIVVTGAAGSGKSELVQRLLDRSTAGDLTVAQIAASALNGEDGFSHLAEAFGAGGQSGVEAATADLDTLETFLQGETRAGRRCLLIVDGSETLEPDGFQRLRELAELRLGSQSLLQGILVGSSDFLEEQSVHGEVQQLRQNVVASYELAPLDAEETHSFVYERLQRVGWNGHPSIEEQMLDVLVDETQGSLRQINQIMNRLLLVGALEESDALTAEMLGEVIKEMKMDVQIEQRTADAVETTDGEVADQHAQQRFAGAELETALAALQQVGKPPVSGNGPSTDQAYDDLTAAVAKVEKRLDEQEQSLRHVLTMLIEWLEDEETQEAA